MLNPCDRSLLQRGRVPPRCQSCSGLLKGRDVSTRRVDSTRPLSAGCPLRSWHRATSREHPGKRGRVRGAPAVTALEKRRIVKTRRLSGRHGDVHDQEPRAGSLPIPFSQPRMRRRGCHPPEREVQQTEREGDVFPLRGAERSSNKDENNPEPGVSGPEHKRHFRPPGESELPDPGALESKTRRGPEAVRAGAGADRRPQCGGRRPPFGHPQEKPSETCVLAPPTPGHWCTVPGAICPVRSCGLIRTTARRLPTAGPPLPPRVPAC